MSTALQAGPVSLVRQRFLRSNALFSEYSAVFEVVAARLRERLDILTLQPKRVLDLGCRTGYQLDALQRRYPEAQIVGADPAPGEPFAGPGYRRLWLGLGKRKAPRIACDPHALPFADGCFDLVVSNLLLPWCHAPHFVFEEVARVLAVDGALLFTSAGPDTLREYRKAWSAVDQQLHGFGLIDMHDLGDALLGAGFSAPVLDRDNLLVDYPDIAALQTELRNVGAGNVARGRRSGLMSGSVRSALDGTASGVGRYVVTLELIQGLGWKEQAAPAAVGGDYKVPIETLRGSWKTRAGDRTDQ